MKDRPNNDIVIYNEENQESNYTKNNKLNKTNHKSSFDRLVSNSSNVLDYLYQHQNLLHFEDKKEYQNTDNKKDMSDFNSKTFKLEYEPSKHFELKVDEVKVIHYNFITLLHIHN
jgi:hypothetical protein